MITLIEKVYEKIQWVVLGTSLLAYLFLKTLQADGDFDLVLRDWRTWIDIGFSIFITFQVISIGDEKGTADGIAHVDFKIADEVNRKIIVKSKNKIKEMGVYVKEKNKENKENAKNEWLDERNKHENELTFFEKLKLKAHLRKIKPITLAGFNNPILIGASVSEKVVSYDLSYNATNNKGKKLMTKIISSIVLSSVAVGVSFSVSNFGDALAQLMVIGAGATASMLFAIYKPYNYLTKKVPQIANAKADEWLAFKEWHIKKYGYDIDHIVKNEEKQENITNVEKEQE